MVCSGLTCGLIAVIAMGYAGLLLWSSYFAVKNAKEFYSEHEEQFKALKDKINVLVLIIVVYPSLWLLFGGKKGEKRAD